jgi:RNA polymerase sigma-70 factor (ECF subfamily)
MSLSPAGGCTSEPCSFATADEYRLMSEARCGNRDACGELLERYTDKILHITRRITRNQEDAEDALQECFTSAFIHLGSFDGRSRFSTWLTRIAMNAAYMRLRKNRGLREEPMEEPTEWGEVQEQFEVRDAAPNPEEMYIKHELHRILREAVVELRPKLRETLHHHLKQESLHRTAAILGISETAVKGRLFHAKVALRHSPKIKAICGSNAMSKRDEL